jgi:uncharacterized protein (TIGR00251 family)
LKYFVYVKFNSSGKIQVNGNEITISIKSEPKHGKANKEMIKMISDFFGVPENSIHIISGLTSRKKIIEIQNI